MHMYIKYDGTEEEKRLAAIRDVEDWLGKERFARLTAEFAAAKLEFDQFEMFVSIAGISGYPVRAWFDHIENDVRIYQ